MKVECDVWRFDGNTAETGRYDSYLLDVDPSETVLGILVKINQELDAGLSFRFACGVVKCGECALEVNGSPCLACERTVEAKMTIRPLPGLPLIKDLVIDRRAVLDGILKTLPGFERTKEGPQFRSLDSEDADSFVRLTKCFECLMCQSACPVHAGMKDRFVGPLGLVWLAQMSLDPGKKSVLRHEIESALEMCLKCGVCSGVCACPEDIISLAIDVLER